MILSLIVVNTSYQWSNPQKTFENPKLNAGEITIITPENKTYTTPDSGYYPATYGFENELDGTSGTAIDFIDAKSAPAYCLILSNYDPLGIDNHNKILEFQSTGDPHFAYHRLSSQKTTGAVEFYVNFDETNENHIFGLYETTNYLDGAIQLNWRDNGYLSYNDGSWNDIEPYSSNTWYHIKIEFNITEDWHLWIDEAQKDSSGYSYLSTISYFEYLWIEGSSTADIKFDAFGYSWDPFYSIGDNLQEGLLLSYQNLTILDWQGYSLDAQANKTIIGNSSIPIPSDGTHSIQLFGNNSSGNMFNSTIRHFSVDTTSPEILITYPSPDQEFTDPPGYILSITEPNIAEMWYTLNGGFNTTITSEIGTIASSAWNSLANGPVTIRFYVRDIADREAFGEVIVVKIVGASTPPGIPGYDLIVLFGVSCVLILIILKKRSK
ncbi:MAG: hypothetical protein ACFFCC_18860 [Promethearchaeota archaeon]